MRALRLLAIVLMVTGAFPLSCQKSTADDDESKDSATSVAPGKTALMVIAPDKFNDDELALTREALENAEVKVTLASTTTDEVTGMQGAKATPELLISAADGTAYDAVVFIGGSGTAVLLDDAAAHALATAAYNAGKLLAAICMAPEILANAGLLDGVRATCWSGGTDNLAAKGAIVVDDAVVVDGRIITGNGPGAAAEFGAAIVAYLAAN